MSMIRRPAKTSKSGFTLVEMSIVLLIIGFLTAAILTGKSLIRQSQINSAAIDVQRYITATQNFKQKYNALPGDMPNATSYWGAMTTCPPPYGSASQGGILTCNGNGDGVVMNWQNTNSTNVSETFLFWQHLANAQLIEGTYTGIAGRVGSLDDIIGINSPAGRLPGLGYGMFYAGTLTGNSGRFDGNYGHVIDIGSYASGGLPEGGIITPLEAQSFDNKYDDGGPATGSIRTFKHGSGNSSQYCATTNVSSTALYNTAAASTNSTGPQCSFSVITGF